MVLKDWKLNPGNDGLPPFTAQPEEVFNYYAFGMMIPGFFSNATTEYRFGFNGMLSDDDVRDKKYHYFKIMNNWLRLISKGWLVYTKSLY